MSPMKLRIGGLVAATLVGIAGATTGIAPHHVHAQTSAPVVVTISDSGVDVPDTVAPGIESFTIVNGGAMPHSLAILRLNTGVTLDQLFAAAAQAANGDPAALIALNALIAPNGGADMLDPGSTQQVVLNLTAGNYVAVDEDHATEGVVKPFQVSGAATTAIAPAADVKITEREFAFDLPDTVLAGTSVFQVTNAGQQDHMMVLARLDPGYTVQDALAHIEEPNPPSWVHEVPGVPDLAPGATVWATLNLDPGTYVALCFDIDPATMMPHVALGMVGTFTAK